MWEIMNQQDNVTCIPGDEQASDFLLIDIKKVGDRIRQAREAVAMTQAELAEKIGKSAMTVSHIENGQRSQVNPACIHEIAIILGKSEAFIYGLPEELITDASTVPTPPQKISPALNTVWSDVVSLPIPQQTSVAHILQAMLTFQKAR